MRPAGSSRRPASSDLGVQSAMYVPLIWKGEVLGVLYLDASSRKAAFGIDDLRLMQVMATQAAMFVKNLSLQQVLQREAVVKSRLLAQFPRPIAERLARQPGPHGRRQRAGRGRYGPVRGRPRIHQADRRDGAGDSSSRCSTTCSTT